MFPVCAFDSAHQTFGLRHHIVQKISLMLLNLNLRTSLMLHLPNLKHVHPSFLQKHGFTWIALKGRATTCCKYCLQPPAPKHSRNRPGIRHGVPPGRHENRGMVGWTKRLRTEKSAKHTLPASTAKASSSETQGMLPSARPNRVTSRVPNPPTT